MFVMHTPTLSQPRPLTVDVYTFVYKTNQNNFFFKKTPKTVVLYIKEHVCTKKIIKFRVGFKWVKKILSIFRDIAT